MPRTKPKSSRKIKQSRKGTKKIRVINRVTFYHTDGTFEDVFTQSVKAGLKERKSKKSILSVGFGTKITQVRD